jgi:alginate O-acetyltransferase complex protein AlgI
MLFHTFEYGVFLVVVVYLWYHLSGRQRLIMLVAASYLFYGVWSVKYSVLMVFSTVLDYYAAKMIASSTSPGRRRFFLLASIIGNLTVLGYFKYTNFALQSAGSMLTWLGLQIPPVELKIILPLGISFYTFDEISYTTDVYRGKMKPVPDILTMASFVSFFPQLVAGPLQRSWHLVPQLVREPAFDWLNIRIGVNLILWGLFKKVVLADTFGAYSDAVFAAPAQYSSLGTLLGVYAFAFQIYLDFSAYSHIAMGSARLLGVRFTKNFDLPYLATDISDFWRRWHITLSTWLRDYLYVPLGGSRRGERRTYLNLLLTMVIGGAWHGANWTFVVWGFYHGSLLAVTRMIKDHVPAALREAAESLRAVWIVLTFNLVCVGWVFFRAPTLASARDVFRRIAALDGVWLTPEMGFLAVLLAGAYAGHVVAGATRPRWGQYLTHDSVRLDVAYACLMLLCLVIGASSGVTKFIYFEF